MALKGDKAKLYDIAMRMYVDGGSLSDIETALGVSRQTLAVWKADTKRPTEELDEWDKARQVKRSSVQRINDLYIDDQLTYVEETLAANRDSKMIDALSKLGALVERFEKIAAMARKQALEEAADVVDQTAKQAGVSEETIQIIRRDVLRMAS